MAEDREPRRVYSPGDVAERLGVSEQRLRQLAAAFERVRGELPRDERRARVWPEESVEELERARALGRRQPRASWGVQAWGLSGVVGVWRSEIMQIIVIILHI